MKNWKNSNFNIGFIGKLGYNIPKLTLKPIIKWL